MVQCGGAAAGSGKANYKQYLVLARNIIQEIRDLHNNAAAANKKKIGLACQA